jgi:flavin-dependent dehydrogenase
VVGGGPAGSAAAISLAAHGRRTLLVHCPERKMLRVGETLGPNVALVLRRLGAWEDFIALGSEPCHGNQSAWGTAAADASSFIVNPVSQQGWHTDRDRFDAMLRGCAGRAGAAVLSNCRVLAVEIEQGEFHVRLDGGREIVPRAVVDATGRRASVARHLGARRVAIDRLVAAAARLSAPRPLGGYGLVEAVDGGWWFSAPLPGNRAIAAFLTDSDISRSYGLGQAWQWRALLERTALTRRRLRECSFGRLEIFPAVSHRLKGRALPPFCVAAGDAALAADPLSGSGVERALRSGIWAACAIDQALAGSPQARSRYEDALDAEFAAYRMEREAIYALEARWPDALFWKRRRAAWTALSR